MKQLEDKIIEIDRNGQYLFDTTQELDNIYDKLDELKELVTSATNSLLELNHKQEKYCNEAKAIIKENYLLTKNELERMDYNDDR